MERRRILIVDDESAVRMALQRVLVRAGYSVVVSADALDALQKVLNPGDDELPYDLLITDMQMPGFTGIELIEKLHKNGKYLPTLPIAGVLDAKTREWLQGAGCEPLLEKPFSREELFERVEGIFAIA